MYTELKFVCFIWACRFLLMLMEEVWLRVFCKSVMSIVGKISGSKWDGVRGQGRRLNNDETRCVYH